MRAASRHRAIQHQLAKRARDRDAMAARTLRDLDESGPEPPGREHFCPDEVYWDDEEPVHTEPVLALRDPGEEDPLESEEKEIHAWCQERLELVTAVVESAVPMLLMAARHAVTDPAEARQYMHDYLTWKHAVLRLWRPRQDWVAAIKLVKQSALVASVETAPEFKAVRRLLDSLRKATPEYKDAERDYRRRPDVMERNAKASALRMKRYRERLASKA